MSPKEKIIEADHMNIIHAPFTNEQVEKLNKYQMSGVMHPFTCMGAKGCKRSEQENEGLLTATNDGWVCPCGKYRQDWAWEFMLHSDEIQERISKVFGV
jgi:hypothetical protein